MKKEKLKSLIYKRFEECETISQFREDVFNLIDLYFEESENKYYFFTIQAENSQGSISNWNYISDKNPLDKLINIKRDEENGFNTYHNFIILNCFEITEEQFFKYRNQFEN